MSLPHPETEQKLKLCRKPGPPCFKHCNKRCIGCGYLLEITVDAYGKRMSEILKEIES
jgi:hypothetical protein